MVNAVPLTDNKLIGKKSKMTFAYNNPSESRWGASLMCNIWKKTLETSSWMGGPSTASRARSQEREHTDQDPRRGEGIR
jgi:hypothetical protein